MSSRNAGAAIIIATAILGFAISLYNYLTPLTGINGTFGALLVCASSIALVIDGISLFAVQTHGFRTLWLVLGVFGAVGTFIAGYFLHVPVLMMLMVVLAIGLALSWRRGLSSPSKEDRT